MEFYQLLAEKCIICSVPCQVIGLWEVILSSDASDRAWTWLLCFALYSQLRGWLRVAHPCLCPWGKLDRSLSHYTGDLRRAVHCYPQRCSYLWYNINVQSLFLKMQSKVLSYLNSFVEFLCLRPMLLNRQLIHFINQKLCDVVTWHLYTSVLVCLVVSDYLQPLVPCKYPSKQSRRCVKLKSLPAGE